MKTFFWYYLHKKAFHVFFCKRLAPFFEIKQRWVPYFPRFSGILPGFSENQNLWGCACTACTPTSYTTALNFFIFE